jgi:hypothetical protein
MSVESDKKKREVNTLDMKLDIIKRLIMVKARQASAGR